MKMAKENPKNPKDPVKPNSGSGSSEIFKTLFGDLPEIDNPSTSIFSNSNPFRRKSLPQNPRNDASDEPIFVADDNIKKKRKRVVQENVGTESVSVENGSEDLSGPKKSKINKGLSSDFGANLFEDDSVVASGSKKSKRNKGLKAKDLKLGEFSPRDEPKNPNLGDDVRNPDLGLESNGEKVPNLGSESDEIGKEDEGKNPNLGDKGMEKRSKKKRKRDELEEEYEVMKYGAKREEEEGALGVPVVGEKRKTRHNAAEMLISKEGYDDESKLLRTVFVGNLPLKVKKKYLLKEFSQFGEVESVRIRSVPLVDTKTPRKGAIFKKLINDAVDSVHAYVVFVTEESARASLALNMALIGENHIRVDRALPPRKKLKGESTSLYERKKTVFLGNLPFDVKDEEIYELFKGFNNVQSSIEAIRVIRDPNTSAGKGIAYVLFKTREAANLVVNKANLTLRNRSVRLYHAKDSTPAKRENPSRSFSNNSPAKRFAVSSTTPGSNGVRAKPIASSSYQGLRASKSGVQKKVSRKPIDAARFRSNSQTQTTELGKRKDRSGKRPAVAARKAKALKGGGGSGGVGAGKKRKPESHSPGSFKQNKKARRF